MTKRQAKKISKFITAAVGAAGAFGVVPPELVNLFGDQITSGVGALIMFGAGFLFGKEFPVKTIAKELGMDTDKVEKLLKNRDALKKLMQSIVICFIPIIFLASCSTKQYTPPEGCIAEDGNVKQSVILDKISYPSQTALVLKLTSYELVERAGLVSPYDYRSFIENLLSFVEEPDITYADLYFKVRSKVDFINDKVQGEVFILAGALADIGSKKIPIYECDRVLIKKHLEEHLEMAKMMIE